MCVCVILVAEMSNFIGPALPPHLQKKLQISDGVQQLQDINESGNSRKPKIDLTLPHKLSESPEFSDEKIIGPALPPHLRQKSNTEKNSVNVDSEDVLILHAELSDEETFKNDPNDEMYGPALPPGFAASSTKSTKQAKKDVIGPDLPLGMKLSETMEDDESSNSDTDIVGPMPMSEGQNSSSYIQNQLNERALRMKRKLTGKVTYRFAY